MLDKDGNLLSQFGLINSGMSQPEFRAHLTQADGEIYRSNGTFLKTISHFDANGNQLADIVVDSSATHQVNAIAADFADQSIFFVDIFAGTNVVRHLDDPTTGASSFFAGINYSGIAGVIDLYFGGPAGSEALYALNHTAPFAGGIERVARIDSNGTVTFLDNPEFDTPYVTDIGAIAVDPRNGDVVVATGTKVVRINAAGAPLGSFPLVDTKPSLDIDSDGTIYVGSFNTGEIHMLDETGVQIKVLQVPGATQVFDVLIRPGTDSDLDGVPDDDDACPNTAAGPVDTAGCSDIQVDGDSDGYCDVGASPSGGPSGCIGTDNCPTVPNPDQLDSNGDGFGDACVDPSSSVDDSVDIGENPVIGDDVSVGKDSSIGDDVVIGDDVTTAKDTDIGDDSTIGSETTVKKETAIGDGVVIGSKVKIAKGVIIGNNVIIGDNVTIEKDVVIGDNVVIGDGLTIAMGTVIPDGTVFP